MREGEAEKQFKMLQQEIALAGEELEAVKRTQRAEMDALRLEVETLRRCLGRVHPGFEECYAAVRVEVTQSTDPEALWGAPKKGVLWSPVLSEGLTALPIPSELLRCITTY